MAERPLILVVEDEYLLQADVLAALSKGGFEADGVYSGEEALEAFANRPYKILITDARLGGDLTGWEVARRIREKDCTFPVIYLTASAVAEWASEGRQYPHPQAICNGPAHGRSLTFAVC